MYSYNKDKVRFDKLTAYLDSLPEKGYPGVDCAVVQDHEVLFRHQSGFADLESQIPLTPDRTYFIYSATKVITSVAAMQLYEQGKFKLDDPIADYIPAFQKMYVYDADGNLAKAKTAITIKHLLTMTAGIAYDYKCPSILSAQQAYPDGCTTAQIVDAIAQEPLLYEPGTNWNYSFSIDIIGRLIEVISGTSLGQYLQKHLFVPLNMTNTGFDPTQAQLSKMAVQYDFLRDKGTLERTPFVNYLSLGDRYESGGAGLISTVDDGIKFADAMCCGGISRDGVQILNADTIRLMGSNHLTGNTLNNFQWYPSGFGYGFGVRTLIDKSAMNTLGSIGEFGWYGAKGFWFAIDPSKKLAIVYAQHRGPSDSGFVQPPIREAVYEALNNSCNRKI